MKGDLLYFCLNTTKWAFSRHDFNDNIYQLPPILLHCYMLGQHVTISRHVPLSGHNEVALFERHCQWHLINTKINNYVIIASLNSESAR